MNAYELSHLPKRSKNKFVLSDTGDCYGICNNKEQTKFYFDLEDYIRIKDYTWSLNYADHPGGYERISTSSGINPFTAKKSHLKLHQLIFGDRWVDHIDRNPMNCRKSNLRKTTPQLNAYNKSAIGGDAGIKQLADDQFSASLKYMGKEIILSKVFRTFKEAKRERMIAYAEIAGEFTPYTEQEYSDMGLNLKELLDNRQDFRQEPLFV